MPTRSSVPWGRAAGLTSILRCARDAFAARPPPGLASSHWCENLDHEPWGWGILPSDSSRLKGGASSHAPPKGPKGLQEGFCQATEPAQRGAKRTCFRGTAGPISGRQAHVCALAARLGRALLRGSTTQSLPDSPAASAFAQHLAAAGLRKSSGSSCLTLPSAPAASGGGAQPRPRLRLLLFTCPVRRDFSLGSVGPRRESASQSRWSTPRGCRSPTCCPHIGSALRTFPPSPHSAGAQAASLPYPNFSGADPLSASLPFSATSVVKC